LDSLFQLSCQEIQREIRNIVTVLPYIFIFHSFSDMIAQNMIVLRDYVVPLFFIQNTFTSYTYPNVSIPLRLVVVHLVNHAQGTQIKVLKKNEFLTLEWLSLYWGPSRGSSPCERGCIQP
jgi:hypothetical protein